MHQLESGDLFVVSRGVRINTSGFLFGSFLAEVATAVDSSVEQYDRSYTGRIFRVDVVSGPVVAATCIWGGGRLEHQLAEVGRTISFHAEEVELWPVPAEYLAALESRKEGSTT